MIHANVQGTYPTGEAMTHDRVSGTELDVRVGAVHYIKEASILGKTRLNRYLGRELVVHNLQVNAID